MRAASQPRGDALATGSATGSPENAAKLLNSAEASHLPGPEATTAPAQMPPFVRSKPQAVPPFPIVLNRAVKAYVDEYLAQPAGLRQSFRRSQPYMAEMMLVLQSEDLPQDLVYLPFAESGFSKNGAGPWQLSKSTAREYGLTINHWVDERRDPIKSTIAAAEYLDTLYDKMGDDWHMTLVAWNNGDSAVGRYLGLEDASYERLMRHLPWRTRSLMNRFMAVAVIAHHAREYGMDEVGYQESPEYQIVTVRGGTTLDQIARQADTSVGVLRTMNPALLRDRIPPRVRAYPVRIPDGQLESNLLAGDY
jgi:peptidoglycan lytic transglycosylase D